MVNARPTRDRVFILSGVRPRSIKIFIMYQCHEFPRYKVWGRTALTFLIIYTYQPPPCPQKQPEKCWLTS